MNRPFTPLVKPASGDCQLLCRYCFYRVNPAAQPPGSGARMSDEVLDRFTREFLAYQPLQAPANICWQGGEPLLMGLDFFKRAVSLQQQYKKPGQDVVNSMQTNGVAIDRDWARFFHDQRVLVGISLDGPQEIHDAQRKDIEGAPTYDRVMGAIELMRSAGAQFNILTVLHHDNAHQAGEIYEFFREQGFRFMQFIACIEPGREPGELAPFSLLADEYAEALGMIARRWTRDIRAGRMISVRFFDHVLNKLVGAGSAMCLFEGHCDGQIVIEHDGKTYPCDWHVDDQWLVGNILDTPFAELVDSARMRAFTERGHKRPTACDACRWLPLCNGGCPKHREILSGSTEARNFYCEAYQRFYQSHLREFQEIASMLTRRMQPSEPPAGSRPSAQAKTSRNAPCPCGSGRKFKHCCARAARR
jgi:anaerobic sulfatase-maturating enzyme